MLFRSHMTESRYLFAGSETCDAFLRLIGADLDYVKGGHSYYTAESHVMHLGEAKLGDRLTGSVQVLMADEKRLHLVLRIERAGEGWRRWSRCCCMSTWRRARPATPRNPCWIV